MRDTAGTTPDLPGSAFSDVATVRSLEQLYPSAPLQPPPAARLGTRVPRPAPTPAPAASTKRVSGAQLLGMSRSAQGMLFGRFGATGAVALWGSGGVRSVEGSSALRHLPQAPRSTCDDRADACECQPCEQYFERADVLARHGGEVAARALGKGPSIRSHVGATWHMREVDVRGQ